MAKHRIDQSDLRLATLTGLIGGITIGVILARKLTTNKAIPSLKIWHNTWNERYGIVAASVRATKVQKHYDQLMAAHPQFTPIALQQHLENKLLPGIALYQTLLEDGLDQEVALGEVQYLLGLTVIPYQKLWRLLDFVPDQLVFPLFRRAVRCEIDIFFPSEGWKLTWIEDNQERIAFDIQDCFYLNVLKAYGVPELTPIFCHLDDIFNENKSATILWQRSTTIGRGDVGCDFCWVNTNSSKQGTRAQ